MAVPKHVEVRGARDRVVDLLGLGQTYPIQDVEVQSVQLTVSVNERAAIEIRPGQEEVRYELYEGAAPVDPEACHVVGNGGETELPGPIITLDRTFKILATKVRWPTRSVFLHQTAAIKVGLDASLAAAIVGLPRLHPELVSPPAVDPWVAEHGAVAEVVVSGSQPSASYRLSYGAGGAEVLTEPTLSKGGDLSLFTGPVDEDTLIRIRVERDFGPEDHKQEWLAAELPLAVRADPSLAVSLDGSPLVDPAAAVTVAIAESQPSVAYGAYARPLRDRDFVRGASTAEPIIAIPVPASLDVSPHEVWVRSPARPDPWQAQPGYEALGAEKQGTGAGLTLELGPGDEDRAIVVKARKQHFSSGLAGTLRVIAGRTELQLGRSLVTLARPNPAPTLALEASSDAAGLAADLLVSGGQQGVFYHFRNEPDGPELGLPAYIHRLDEDDPRQNRGVGQLELEQDFSLARATPPGQAAPETTPELTRPLDPIVEVAPVPPGEVNVMAVKARTGVGWPSSRPFVVTVKPKP